MRTGTEYAVAAASADTLGESPVWCDRQQALYWVDIRAPAMRRLKDGEVESWPLPELCGAVALAEPPFVVLALKSGFAQFDTESCALRPLVAPEPPSFDNRLNDTKCDRRGRLWTGTMRDFGAASTGSLYRVGQDLSCTRMLSGLTIPNALCWSPDDRTFYFADTADGALRAYPFDAEAGRLGAMRVLVAKGVLPGKPDGATVDAEGCLWNARFGAGVVARIAPDGRVDRIIELPTAQVTSCGLGGPGLRTLYVTSARQRMSAAELVREPLAGSLFAIDVAVGGLPEPRFRPPG